MAFATAGVGACGGNAFTTGSATSGDASLVDGPGVGDGGEGGTADAPSDSMGVVGKTVFVSTSPSADDSNTGLDPAHPKKTIVSAIAEADTLGTGAEVHVCAGSYAESSLAITQDVIVRGGYDCDSLPWTRSPAYGFPTFDQKHVTVVTNGAPLKQEATLSIRTAAVTSATLVDGLAIMGGTGTLGTSFGIDVSGPASPTISNDVVEGGMVTAMNSEFGSVGVRIGDTAAPEVTACAITGGSGEGQTGSAGIVMITTGLANVHDLLVTGGTGVSTGAQPDLGAVGVAIVASAPSPKPLASVIVGGTDMAGTSGKSVGIYVAGTNTTATIDSCEVQGGTGTSTGTSSAAIDLETTGAVTLLGDRIFGGVRKGGSSQTYGVRSNTVGSLSIADCEIHAGEVTPGTSSNAVGVSLGSAAAPNIVDDTIYGGTATGSSAVFLGASVTGAILSGDILLGGGSGSSQYAIVVAKSASQITAVTHSAFIDFPGVYQCTQSGSFATDPGALAGLLSPGAAANDFELENVCAGATQPWCIQNPSCPSMSAQACAQAVFGSTFTSDDGVTGLFTGPPAADGGTTVGAWTLQSPAPCALAHQGAPLQAVPVDIFGVTRGSSPSMGAVQYTSSVCSMM
jgi:hypothetical protein